jgi:glycerol-3-phosphate dehydrogenase
MTKNGRHIMLMPWRNHSLIGTTDKEYNGNPDNYRVTRETIHGLIDDLNENFGCKTIKYDDVIFAYGGLRPLVDDQTEGSYESSRKYEIFDNSKQGLDGLITIEGGKYTTSRRLACQAMRMVARKLNRKLGRSITNKKFLDGCDIKDMNLFLGHLRLEFFNYPSYVVDYIGKNYGQEGAKLFELAEKNPALAQTVSADGEILASVEYAIRYEMAKSLNDILFRRTGIGTLGYPGDEIFSKVVNLAKELLGWNETKTQQEIDKAMQVFKLPD